MVYDPDVELARILAAEISEASGVAAAASSRSDAILEWARVLMAALGFHPDGVVLRNAREDGWRDGLAACDIVAADVITAKELSGIPGLAAFRIISPESLAEARAIVTACEVS